MVTLHEICDYNRFSKDVGVLDDQLTTVCMDFFRMAIEVFGTVVLACVANPFLLLVMPVVVWLCIYIYIYVYIYIHM